VSFRSALYVSVIRFGAACEYGVDYCGVGNRKIKRMRGEEDEEINRVD
jgi:hypothetical protein